MNYLLGEFFSLFAAICWAQNALIFSWTGKKISSRTTTHMRLWLALPFIFIIHYLFRGVIFPILPAKGLIFFSISGFIGFFLADLLLFEAFVRLGAKDTMLIMTSVPFIASFFSYFIFNEALKGIYLVAMVITIFGIALVIMDKNAEIPVKHKLSGIFLALASAVGQALGLIFSKLGLNCNVNPISGNLVRIIAGFLGLLFYAILKKEIKNDFKKIKNKKIFLLLLFATFFGPVLGVLLSLYAMNYAPVGIVSTLMQTSPLFILIIEYLLYKKKASKQAFIGVIVAIFGAALFFLF